MAKTSFLVALLAVAATVSVAQAETPSYRLTIENHRFSPEEIEIPANTKVRLVVANRDDTPEEFESHSLHREKVIPAGQEGVIFVGPLAPGAYEFVGEFHEDTAKGRIVVK